MCGIAGLSQATPVDRNVLAAAVEALAHRGPDSNGIFVDPSQQVGLGHTRLSIIDLSPAGHQPMSYEDSGVTITYNGEIYNYLQLRDDLRGKGYTFRSESDTEVLLAGYLAWGVDVLERLNGIFAFAIHDARQGFLFLARDHLGIKPLYYSQDKSGFAFASEIKALFKLKPIDCTLDLAAIARYVAFLWSPGEQTPLTAVKKLPAGTGLMVRDGQIERQWTSYHPPVYSPRRDWDKADCAKALGDLVNRSVERQMVADAPLGAFLSGGLDSSAVAAAAQRVNPNLECFTINLKGGAEDGTTDDLPYARQVAQHLDVKLHEVEVSSQTMCDDVERMVHMLDEPLADPACLNVYYISKLSASHGMKVLLSGVGGDDLFTGYRRHQALALEPLWSLMPGGVRKQLARMTAGGDNRRGLQRRMARLFNTAAADGDERMIDSFIWGSRASVMELLSSEVRDALADEPLSGPLDAELTEASMLPAVEKCLTLERRFFLGDHNLNYTDKMAMAAGVEVRVPLLDPELIAFAATIPVEWKQRRLTSKWIFKESQRGILPPDVIDRPKTGFGAPLRRWLSNGMNELVNDLLSPAAVRNRGLFRAEAVQELITANSKGRVDGSYTLFSLMCIELWCRTFLDQQTAHLKS